MALSLPYPNSPQDGDAFLSLPVRSNVNAITQAIQSFDGMQVQAGSIAATALAPAANPITRGAETLSNFVVSGCIWSAGGGLLANMTAGTVYVNGVRVSVLPVTGKVLSVSTDYYVDVDTLGNLYYLAVGSGVAAPALTGNSVRIARLTTNASVLSGQYQLGFDTNGVSIYPQVSSKVNKYFDASGWVIHDSGDRNKEYMYTTASVLPAQNWGPCGGNFWTVSITSGIPLPSGISSWNQLHISHSVTTPAPNAASSPLISQIVGTTPIDTPNSTGTLSLYVNNPSNIAITAMYVSGSIRATPRF